MNIQEGAKDGETPSTAPHRQEHGEFFAMLKELSLATPHVLARRSATVGELQRLSAYVAEVRRLLDELARLEDRKQCPALPAGICGELAERFLDLEGFVKELRNDLMGSPAPDPGKSA